MFQTGVYSNELIANELNHAPRDFLSRGAEYLQPAYTVQDVNEAIDMIFELERFQ